MSGGHCRRKIQAFSHCSAEREKIMEKNEFASKVCRAVKKELGEEYRVEIKEIRKNNGILLPGLSILWKKSNVAPTIYLDSYWKDYENGMTFAEVIRELLEVYRKELPEGKVDVEFFQNFDRIKETICYRLIGQKGNEELLEDIPHLEFLDLALCFFCVYRGGQMRDGSILIHNAHQERWGVSTADLLRAAEENTPRLFPWESFSVDEMLAEMGEKPESGKYGPGGVPMKVLTNQNRTQGAACIVYPGLLQQLAEEEKGSFYILPCSVHETILLSRTGREEPEELRSIIKEANETCVEPEEVLSDSLYFYDYEEKQLKILTEA